MTMTGATIALSFDVDWAPEEVLADTIALLDRFGARATFFATHDSPVLRALDSDRYEIGIHPNFNPLLDGQLQGDFRRIFDALLDLYPDAIGLRSHSVVTSGPILAHAVTRGIRYESNTCFPLQIAPFRDFDGLFRVPMYWCDYREMLVASDFATQDVAIANDAPAVFAFHPTHVFLNTERVERYTAIKSRLSDVAHLAAARNDGSKVAGTRDFLLRLLERSARERIPTAALRDVVREHAARCGDEVARPPTQRR